MDSNSSNSAIRAFRSPIHIDFNLTNGCNLVCSHCHSSSGKYLPNELTTDEILSAIRDLHALGVMSIAFAGGEPFIRKDILTILTFACSLPGWSTGVISNGFFLRDAQLVEQIAQRCPTLGVNISLDGSNGLQQNQVRKHRTLDSEALFNHVIEGITRVRDAGLHTSVNFVLTRQSIRTFLSTYHYVSDILQLPGMVAIKFFPGGFGIDNLHLLEIPFIEWADFLADITKHKIAGQLQGVQLSVPAAWEFYLPMALSDIDITAAEAAWGYRAPLRGAAYAGLTTIGDSAGIGELAIAANGQVFPSILMIGNENFMCGNIRQNPIGHIWRNSPVLRSLRGLTINDLDPQCKQCSFRDICGGGSRSRALVYSGDYRAPDYQCPLLFKAPRAVKMSTFYNTIDTDSFDNSSLSVRRIAQVAVLSDSTGCEVRTPSVLFRGNAEMSRVIALVLEKPTTTEIRHLCHQYQLTVSDAFNLVRQSLGMLTEAGCPHFWNDGWDTPELLLSEALSS